jgi:hypothetical protein
MLEIQNFLRTPGNKPEDMTTKYGVAVRRHPKYPNLILFKYSQIESPMGEKIVQECRGIILDESKDWAVVSFPYTKFFNHGEGHAAVIDWSTAKVFEKVDGSLMTLYWYDNQWQVASSGSPDAGGDVYGYNLTFKDLFWKVWKELGYKLPDEEHKDICFMFELCTPYNKIVVQHTQNRIVFHGCRDLIKNYEEVPVPDQAVVLYGYNWEIVKSYPLGSIEDVLKTMDSIPPTEGEGYVICDGNFNRIKVKTPQYVALAHMRDGMGSRRMLEVIRSNESSEFLTYFPEFKSLYDQIKEKYDALVSQIESAWEKVKDIPVGEDSEQKKSFQKEYARAVISVPFNGILFGLRNKQIESVKHGLRETHIKYLMQALKIKEIIVEV